MGRVIGAALLVAGLALVPGAARPPPTRFAGNWTFEEAKQFRRYQLYNASPAAGLRLTAVERVRTSGSLYDTSADFVMFLYGECDYTLDEHGCALPLVIQIRPACGGVRLRYPTHVVRGVPARLWSHDHLGVWAGRVFVAIYADEPELLWKVARALAPVNEVDVARGHRGDLPPPTSYPANSTTCLGKSTATS